MKSSGCFGVGSALLALIFTVLCLTASALLTLSCVIRDKALAEKLEDSVSGYYSADCKAVETAVLLRKSIQNGEIPAEINDITIVRGENEEFSYFCSIDEGRAIFVRLKNEDGLIKVLSWYEIYTKPWIPDETLTVWTGEVYP